MAKFTGKLAEFLVNTGTTAPVWTPVGQVQEIGDIAVTAEEVDVTTLDAGDYRDYIQGFKDPGECELTVIFDPNLPTQDASPNGLLGLFNSGVTKQCAIRWNSSGANGEEFGTFTAFIRDMNYGALNPDDPQTINPVWRLTSPIDLADALPLAVLQPSFFPAPAAGASGSFTVTCAPQPTLTATSDSAWLTVDSTVPPTAGGGSVNYTVAPNATGQGLHGHITVLGAVFTVVQDA